VYRVFKALLVLLESKVLRDHRALQGDQGLLARLDLLDRRDHQAGPALLDFLDHQVLLDPLERLGLLGLLDLLG